MVLEADVGAFDGAAEGANVFTYAVCADAPVNPAVTSAADTLEVLDVIVLAIDAALEPIIVTVYETDTPMASRNGRR